ncbi:MAG: hypothetical protein R3C32_06850, partial [Chloroflexota bacterium]
ERQVVVVSAPAGYGKSTFLRQWAEQEGRAVAWVSLEATDDDDALVVDYIVAALERAGSLDAGVPEAGRRGSLSGEALTRLAAAVWGTVRPTVLMIDDVDQMRSPGTLDAMAWLAEHLPPAVRLAVASRARPPLPRLGFGRTVGCSRSGPATSRCRWRRHPTCWDSQGSRSHASRRRRSPDVRKAGPRASISRRCRCVPGVGCTWSHPARPSTGTRETTPPIGMPRSSCGPRSSIGCRRACGGSCSGRARSTGSMRAWPTM